MSKSRDTLVKTRTRLVNNIRSIVKSEGERLPACSTAGFVRQCSEHIPEQLRVAVQPVLQVLTSLNEQISDPERVIDKMCSNTYPEVSRLRQVPGVGSITALTYVLTLEDPSRFDQSRRVGAFPGLTPQRDQSWHTAWHTACHTDKQLRISKAGNGYLRQLLVSCAHYILGPLGPDSDLRDHGNGHRRTWWKTCQEAGRCGGGMQVGNASSPVVG